eukprot:g4703.t1
MSDNKNLLLAAVLSMAVLAGWQYFFIEPKMEAERAVQAEIAAAQEEAAENAIPQVLETRPNSPADLGDGTLLTGLPRDLALTQSERVQIDTDLVAGSISLTGARIDDLQLHTYRETVDPTSPEIVLFSPANSISPYFAEFGWSAPASAGLKLPTRDTVWTAPAGSSLAANGSVTITYDNGEGLVFNRTFMIDENYMFTVEQNVVNNTGAPVTLYPYGLVSRTGTPEIEGFFILHEGMIGVLGEEEGLVEIDYDDILDEREIKYTANEGWLGITDKYWATVLIPEQGANFDARFSEGPNPRKNVYQTDYLVIDGLTAEPGATVSHTARLYAGAKVVDMIDAYDEEGIFRFELLIDWGWFYFLTKPLFLGLDYVFDIVGNFGIAILIVTVIIKIFFFPLANRSYEAMSKMKKLQPDMEKLRDQYADDKMKQQQEIMELYKKEKAELEAGHWLFAQPCTFVKGVVKLDGLPNDALPEIAFAGRSNVGKSSLVNAMTGRKTLARTSNTPGRTQEVNYFTLGQPGREGLFLVDLPGYGYARESKDRIATWTDLVMTYLQGRATLRRVLLLIDARHGIKKNDEEVMAMLDKAAVSYLIVLTKSDKLKKGEIEKRLETTNAQLRKHVAAFPEIAVTSSEKGTGIPELRAHIAELAELAPMGYKADT